MSIITLTTDFGESDSYVGQMKGVILAINPRLQIVDVTHSIPPQDVLRAGAVVEEIARVYPADSIHVAVVDPGVGSDRTLIAAETAGQRFLAPDNGLLGPLFRRFPPVHVHRLTEDRFWRKPVCATFHGRDILAPVAAHWSRGADIADLGPAIAVNTLVKLPSDEPHWSDQAVIGRVEAIDAFGNLITNLRESDLPGGNRSVLLISLGCLRINGISRCYADHPNGKVLALVGSSGRLEIAVNGGSAAKALNFGPGSIVSVT